MCACGARSTWRSTRRRSSRRSTRAPAWPRRIRSRRRSCPITTTIEDYPYDPAAAQQLMIEAGLAEGFDDRPLVHSREPALQPERQARGGDSSSPTSPRSASARTLVSDEWSAYRQKLQNGETSMALYGWTGDNGDPDNFLDVLLGCTAARIGGNNIAQLVQPRLRQARQRCQADHRPRTERERALPRGADHLPRGRAVGAARPFGGLHGDARQRHRLQDGPAWAARLRGGGPEGVVGPPGAGAYAALRSEFDA